jgi:hypothetical protein
MLRIYGSRTATYCDGLSRRSFLQLGVAGVASVSLADVLRAKAQSAETGSAAKDTAIILLWLDGGPSHLDTYDMKPDAPAEFRGFWRPIKTNVPGIEFSELFPRQAKIADKFSIVRSLYHNDGDHFGGAHRMLTGRGGANGANTSSKSPCLGAIAAKVCGPRKRGMLPYIAAPVASSVGLRPGYFGGNYLGREFNPFETEGDPNNPSFKVNSFNLPQGLTLDRLQDRRALKLSLDRLRASADLSGTMHAMDRFEQQAFEFISGDTARKAFDLTSEPADLREKYGRTSFGQSTLLARRLVEAGATFVTVHFGGWDHHWNLQAGLENYLPQVDAAVSSLFEDLAQRGLLEKVLVVMFGEFGRTPRMNNGLGNGTPGRDHWGNAMSCLIGGGGVKGGQIVGATDRRGEAPVNRPVTPQDVHATIYKVLGVDPQIKFLDRSGRPTPAIDNGIAISELF